MSLNFFIKLRKIHVENKKLEVIKDQFVLTNSKRIREFIKFVKFYRIFIKSYKGITRFVYYFIKKSFYNNKLTNNNKLLNNLEI